MNKKGVELPQNVIIIAIIVLVVLVVLIAFFVGGTGSIGQRIKALFGSSVDDRATVVAFCQSYCDTARSYDSDNLKQSSSYCQKSFTLDLNNDGKADTNEDGSLKRYPCSDPDVGVTCPEVVCLARP